MKKLLALFFSLALVFSFSTNATFAANYGNDGVDKDCKDFKTQQEAQDYFEKDGGSASNNVDDLDRDHDGKACEDYKYKGGSDNKSGSGKGSDQDDVGGGSHNQPWNDKSGSSDNNNGTSDSNKDSSNGGKMPKTATNYPIAMFTGALLLLAGMVTLKLRRN